jgi:hypothetical protein
MGPLVNDLILPGEFQFFPLSSYTDDPLGQLPLAQGLSHRASDQADAHDGNNSPLVRDQSSRQDSSNSTA